MVHKIRILIVDDHLIFRLGIRSLLIREPDIELVGEANDHREAIEKFKRIIPNLVILDLRIPGRGGIDILTDILSIQPDAKVLMLSSYANEEEIYRAITVGAKGYVLKDISGDQLVRAIHQIMSGRSYIPPSVDYILAARASRPDLTPRELDVLRLMVKGLTNREIASVLGKSENTIRNQTITIYSKLEVTDRAEAVGASLQRGIVVPNG